MRRILALISLSLTAACSTTIGGQTGEELKDGGGRTGAGGSNATGGVAGGGTSSRTGGASGSGGASSGGSHHDASVPPPDAIAILRDGSTAVAQCDGSACLCDHLVACTPAESFTPLPLGSMGQRVCGIRINKGNPGGLFCESTAFRETEGGVVAVRCETPLGVGCGPGLPVPGSPNCHEVLTCNVLMQSCPGDLLDCSRTEGSGSSDAGLPDARAFRFPDASTCMSLQADIVAEWAKVSECQSQADCETAYNNLCASSGPLIGHVGCFLPVNRSADVTRLSNLEGQYMRECGPAAVCDCTSPPSSTCVSGHCKVAAP
jgi:hypothetical protein